MGVLVDTGGRGRGVVWPLLALVVGSVLVFASTATSIGAIWQRSNTFAHGFLIPPLAGWLIWRRRAALAAIPIRPSPAWILVVGLFGCAWLIGRMGNALILEQYALVFLIPAAIAAVFGPRMVRALLFPLGFLLLAVPSGDALVTPLADFTASFTLRALQISGVPVARSGYFLTLPNGEWSISDACSGFRYLMASLTMGCLYAYLRFRTWRYRLFFVSLSLVLPVLANALRAYVIVLLGYLSDMKLAVGVDHFIYGWLLFAAYSVLLFWLGARLREPAPISGPGDEGAPAEIGRVPYPRMAMTAVVTVLAMGVWPAYAGHLESVVAGSRAVTIECPPSAGTWHATDDPLGLWRPDYSGAAMETVQVYRRGDRVVALYVAYYRQQRHGAELINRQNAIVNLKNREWRLTGERERKVRLGLRTQPFWESRASGAGGNLLIWHRFWAGSQYTASPYVAQLLELKNRILTGEDDAALVAVLAPYQDRPENAAADLREFLNVLEPALEASLHRASKGS